MGMKSFEQKVEPVESNTQPRRRQRPQSTEPMECDLSQDGENEDPITDKTHDLNRLNNNSNNKLSDKSKGVETRGSYIFESPTEEKQIQNGIGENKDDNVEIKTKKTKKKSKKSDGKKDDIIIEDKSNKGDADEKEDTSTQAKPAKKAKKSKKKEVKDETPEI